MQRVVIFLIERKEKSILKASQPKDKSILIQKKKATDGDCPSLESSIKIHRMNTKIKIGISNFHSNHNADVE
jgi:hypothetical protein